MIYNGWFFVKELVQPPSIRIRMLSDLKDMMLSDVNNMTLPSFYFIEVGEYEEAENGVN